MNTRASRGVGYYVNLYRATLRLSFALMMQYRFGVLIWAVWGFVGPLVSLSVWTAATSSRGGAITGGGATYDRADFAAYFLTMMVFTHITMSWDAFEFGWRVRTGALSPLLLRPTHPIHQDASRNVGFKVVSSLMLLPAWLALVWILKPTMPASAISLALAMPALALAAVTRYVLQYALAALAFWTTRVEAVQQLYFTTDSFLGGRIAPMALLPGWLGTISIWLPFHSMGAFPVELALGRVPPDRIVLGFASQIVWVGLSVALLNVVWRAGIKQYSAVGA